MSTPVCADSPFACNRTALSPQVRQRHFEELTPELQARLLNSRELPNGFEFEFASDVSTSELLEEWAAQERLCCSFFDIAVESNSELLNLRLTGPDGVKDFIRAVFSEWSRA